MRISMVMLGAAAVSLALGACTNSSGDAGAADADSVQQAIKADEATMNQDFKAKNMEGLAGHYADDAYFVAGGAAADGSTEIRKFFANSSTDPAFSVSFSSDKVAVGASGDLAYSRGKFTEKYTDPKTSKVMTGSGTFLTVYKKQPDGSWKIVEDVAAVDPASIKEVPPEKAATPAKMVSF
jgi:uncharacterized protein (TIGR02246 family)